jgi:hypothetical protein
MGLKGRWHPPKNSVRSSENGSKVPYPLQFLRGRGGYRGHKKDHFAGQVSRKFFFIFHRLTLVPIEALEALSLEALSLLTIEALEARSI